MMPVALGFAFYKYGFLVELFIVRLMVRLLTEDAQIDVTVGILWWNVHLSLDARGSILANL